VGGLKEKNNWLDDACRRYGVGHLVQTTGHVSREEAQTILMRSALMLLRIVPPMISTKLFEGLRDGVPMLAIIDKGEVEDLVRTYSPHSYPVTSGRVEDVANTIAGAYARWKSGGLRPEANATYIERFNKRAMTERFCDILNQVAHTPSPTKKAAAAPSNGKGGPLG
jgi:hypothetical protein